MRDVLASILSYIMLLITAMTVENAVFARGLGTSTLISLSDDTTDTLAFMIVLLECMTLSGLFYWLVNHYLLSLISWKRFLRPLAAAICMASSFYTVLLFNVKRMPLEFVKKAVPEMPTAGFNSLVIGTIFLTENSRMNLLQTIIFSIGSAVGYTIAVCMTTEGQRRIQNSSVPKSFRGLPVTLIYLSGLSMAVYALTGKIFSI